jgi:2-dehydro-3-deoxyphosphooctonate aldolase (KDO 8-P synthase)
LPGGRGDASGGERKYVPYLARAAAAVGIDALFVEVHPEPDSAPSDPQNMITPEALDTLIEDALAVRNALQMRTSF